LTGYHGTEFRLKSEKLVHKRKCTKQVDFLEKNHILANLQADLSALSLQAPYVMFGFRKNSPKPAGPN